MMNQQRFSNLLERFLDERMGEGEVDVFLELIKGRREDVLIQDTILEKLESGAYRGLSERGRWREVYEEILVRAKEREEMELDGNEGLYINKSKESAGKWGDGESSVREMDWRSLWRRTGVAALVMVLLGVSMFMLMDGSYGVMGEREAVGYARYIVLPDNSSVVLNAGSTLDYPEVFEGGSREVRLKGEAYFDIKRDANRPFIIYTGAVKTTVLGTAFNIKAYPLTSKVTVSVSRGKVKVEDGKKVLAVLDKDEQVIYNIPEAAARQEVVNGREVVTDWAMRDMVFEEVPFGLVAQLIGRRYGVRIEFKNAALKSCTIKASFSGTESLQNVLEVLSTISNASYEEVNGKYVIFGEGCNG